MECLNVKTLAPEETREVQAKMLETLVYFQGFCKEHNLLFYLAGGCLIGAVRHKGFIPWDDDIDLFMPRADYEKLREIWEQHGDKERYTYCRTDREHNYHNHSASLRCNHTTYINRHSANEDICHGMALEIAPIDGCPRSKLKRLHQLFNAFVFGLFNAQRLPNNKGKLLRYLAAFIYAVVPSKGARYRIWKRAEKQISKYHWEDCDCVTELCGSVPGMMWRHPKGWFDHAIYKEFEGYPMPVMAGYEHYLERIWGDYMQLPPEESRVAKHDTVFVSTENSYKDYKGIYYCVIEKDKADASSHVKNEV